MAGGPFLYTSTGTGNLSDILTTIFADDITRNIARACVLPQVLPVRYGRGKNISWVNSFTNGSGYTNGAVADGADVSVFNSDIKVPATLQYTTYVEAVAVGGRAQAAAMASGNPAELADLLGEEINEGITRLASAMSTAFYTGTGASNQLQGLYSTTGTTYGALIATGTYAGIDRSTYTEWACNVDAGSSVNRALTVDLMRDMRRTIYTASQQRPDLIITDPIQYENYAKLLGNNRRYTQEVTLRGQKIVLDGGFMALEFDGIPVLEDINHPAGKMSFLNTSQCYITQLPFYKAGTNDMGEVTLTGTPEEQFGAGNVKLTARIKHLAEAGDATKLEILTYPQIVVKRPNTCGSITYLAS
jgi:hypothetical protein